MCVDGEQLPKCLKKWTLLINESTIRWCLENTSLDQQMVKARKTF